MKKAMKDERGVMFVEAAIVFPVMFIVIFLMIYLGNAYWQRSRVEALTTKYAYRGASLCADPLLASAEKGKLPSVNELQVYPYRMFDGNGVGTTVEDVRGDLRDAIKDMGNGLFRGMAPQNVKVRAEYHNGIIYSTFSMDVDYAIELPIRMIGQKENYSLKMSAHIELPVSDVPEMIRTVDLVEDIMETTGIKGKIEEFTSKMSETLSAVTKWKK